LNSQVDHNLSSTSCVFTIGIYQNHMAPLEILEFPDPRLRTVAKSVKNIDGRLAILADQMLESMYEAPGIGLAASQVNVHKRLIVIDVSENRDQPLVLINPEIRDSEGSIETAEGCLSVPGFYEPVSRFQTIQLDAIGRDGEPYTMAASDQLAVCIQHEMDHLDGKLFVDYLSNAKRSLIRRKLQKLQKQRA
ncbi:uncharacterized protein METZ01_LOCUS440625, partial [marine metagenome]